MLSAMSSRMFSIPRGTWPVFERSGARCKSRIRRRIFPKAVACGAVSTFPASLGMPLLRRIFGAPNVQKHLEKRDVAKLIQDHRDENASVRAQAATALGKLGDSKAAPALIAAYDDEDHAVTDAITVALGEMGPEIFPLLAPLIISGQVWTRGDKGARAAIRTIAARDFDKAAGELRSLIGHS